ncbi:uncharacterized protein LOC131022882 [Salvia miltiorrhiza]|uniref:uncharacterized protein LOC131022882 n=1 Tax=Salvia miltiorrhiza TaxID=226208 RepID=UPI0025AC2A84|nr:uncharacterized protein LOC131022882 [Salvia miltiorrhiza]
MKEYLRAFEESKHTKQREFDDAVDGGAYFGVDLPFPASVKRGIRGPMDRFVANELEDGKVVPPSATAKEHCSRVCLDIGRFFFENSIPFNCVRSPSFISMVRSIGGYGRGLKPPSMHEMRTWILKEEVKTTSAIVDEIKATWKHTGVSLLSDGWSDMRNRSLINFLVNNQYGTMFLKTVDASDVVKNAQKLFELLDEVVEEIGEDHVVQVITDNVVAYKAAGRLLMEKRTSLYWTPCAAHCIDLMLEKIVDFELNKKVAKKDLLRPAATRFATAYLTLESMYELKQPLQHMFVSRDWKGCAWAKKDEGKAVRKIIMSDNSFWASVVYSIKTTKPLVDVLRVVDGERAPAMGFIYATMDEAKEKIAKNLNDEVVAYKEIWNIIDDKWEKQLHRDLHTTAYYLNPQFRWSENVSEHAEIKKRLFNCMERMIKDNDTYLKVDVQLDEYKNKRGLFGSRASMSTYTSRAPVDWWEHFGDEVPHLKAFAKRILGLTCSACERNWSTFNQVHTKKRNRLSTLFLNKLVYIMYNKRLKHKHSKRQLRKEKDDPLVVEDVASDDEWIANPNDENDIDVDDANSDDIEADHMDEGTSSSIPRKRGRNEVSKKGKGKEVQHRMRTWMRMMKVQEMIIIKLDY